MHEQEPQHPQFTIDELAQAIAEHLAPHLTPPDPNQLYTPEDLARIFQVSRSTILARSHKQNWPKTRLGTDAKSDRFTQADLDAIIALNRKEPAPQKVVPKVGTRARRKNQ